MCGGLRWTTTILSLALFARAQVSINTGSNPGSCPTVQVTCTGGTGPYQVQLVPGQHDGPAPMRILTNGLPGNSYQWKVDVGTGTSVALVCKDNTGAKVASNAFSIQAVNSGSDCSNDPSGQAPGSSSSSSSSPSTPPETSHTSTSESSSSPATSTIVPSTTNSGAKSTETFSNTSSSETAGILYPSTDVTSTSVSSPAALNTDAVENSTSQSTHQSFVGPIVGSICALIVILLATVLFLYCRRRRTRSARAISIISDRREDTASQSSFIEPFVSPSVSMSPNSPWNRGPSKFGYSGTAGPHPLPPPSPTTSSSAASSSRTNVLTTEQANLVQQLFSLQVPAPAVTQVIDRMLSQPGSSASGSDYQEPQMPPAYDFKQ